MTYIIHQVAGKEDESIVYWQPKEKNFKAVPVNQLDSKSGEIITTHSSMSVAAGAVGINRSGISSCCRGLRRTAGGFGWQYVETSKRRRFDSREIKKEHDEEDFRRKKDKFIKSLNKKTSGKVWTSIPNKKHNAMKFAKFVDERIKVKEKEWQGKFLFNKLPKDIQKELKSWLPKRRQHVKAKTVFPNKEDIIKEFGDVEALMDKGLIKQRGGDMCPDCSRGMLFREIHRSTEIWRCKPIKGHSKSAEPCRHRYSMFEGSIFEGIRYTQIKPWQVLLLFRHVLEGYVTGQSLTEVGTSYATVDYWRKRIKAILGAARLEEIKDNDGIGGPLEDEILRRKDFYQDIREGIPSYAQVVLV